jgi:hypothetical protein
MSSRLWDWIDSSLHASNDRHRQNQPSHVTWLTILNYFGGCLSENIPFTITHLCNVTKEKYCLSEGHNALYDMTTFPSVPGRAIKTKVCSFLSFFSFKFSRIWERDHFNCLFLEQKLTCAIYAIVILHLFSNCLIIKVFSHCHFL